MDSCAIYYAWTQDNPFTDYQEFLRLNANADKATILARGFGIPTKSVTTVFPAFDKNVNVIEHNKLPWLPENLKKDSKGKTIPYKTTRYMAIDPAGSKSWFALWVAIDVSNTWFIYRENPDHDDWALPGPTPPGAATDGAAFPSTDRRPH